MYKFYRLPLVRRVLKLVSVILCFVFIATQCDANVAQGITKPKTQGFNLDEFQINPDQGMIKETFKSDKTDSPLIIHVQDAHCHFEAQANSAKMISHLMKRHSNHNLELIEVEGAEGRVDTSELTSIPDAEIKKQLATYFLRKGRITAVEYLSIINDKPLNIQGVEDADLYFDNLAVFDESIRLREEGMVLVTALKAALKTIEGFVYDQQLKDVVQLELDYETDNIDFPAYCLELKEYSEQYQISTEKFINFHRVFDVKEKENQIDFNQVDRERLKLIDELAENASEKETTDLLTSSLYYRLEKMSPLTYFTKLLDFVEKNNVSMAKYINVDKFYDYLIHFEKIDREKLFAELNVLNNEIKNVLFKTDNQKQLNELTQSLKVIKNF